MQVDDFWKKMAIRGLCGCLSKDCALHGSYVADELEQVQQAQKEYIVKENNRLAWINHSVRWQIPS